MKALLIYSSHDGQTKKIMAAIAEKLAPHMEYDMFDLNQIKNYVNLSNYDAVCLGASIRYGFFSFKFKEFVNVNSIVLNRMKTAFFSVTLIARKAEKRTPETNSYTRKFLRSILWQPTLTETFAGALRYPEYGWFDRLMIQLIMKISGGETDTSRDIEYTDWAQVDEFAQKFIEMAKTPAGYTGQKLYI